MLGGSVVVVVFFPVAITLELLHHSSALPLRRDHPMNQEMLVSPKEKLYFNIALVVSVLAYLGLVVSVFGIVYILVGALIDLCVHGLFVGQLRGNGVKVSAQQFPDVHEAVRRLSREMGLAAVPDVYVTQAGGLLNAFALRFLGRNFVVLFADVVEIARAEGQQALEFVICHELAHHHRKHTSRRILLLPSMWVPFLGTAYSRACEYTCDAFGAHYCPDGAVDGLLVFSAGKMLYKEVDASVFAQQVQTEQGFWVWFAEKLSSHPNLPKRVAAVSTRLKPRIQVGSLAPVIPA